MGRDNSNRGRVLAGSRRWIVALACIGALVMGASPALAEVTGPGAQDRNITVWVTTMLRAQHLLRPKLDDELSRRAFGLFMKSLDPRKAFFLRSDFDEFRADELKLDDMLRERDTSFAYDVYRRFMQRLDERVAWVDELLEKDFDFTKDEYYDTDFEHREYAKNASEARELWRLRVKYDLLFFMVSDKKTLEQAKERVHRRYKNLQRRWHQIGNDELLEIFLTAVTSSNDPHTTYMAPSTFESFKIALHLRLEGIGAQLMDEDGHCVISKVIPGGAAAKDGKLKAGDRIVSVGQGEEGEMVDVMDMKLTDVVKLIRGRAGTVVRLGVIPADGGEKRVYQITRAQIDLEDSAAKGKVFDVRSPQDGTIQIGVIDVPSFYLDTEALQRREPNYRSTTADVRRILDGFKEKGVDVVVLDLRHNGGGSLREAVTMTGLFIDRGPVVQVRDSSLRTDALDDVESGMAWNGPLVVLTSKLSASASEIFAGAIQDYHRGLIVGDKTTHGKGTVQTLQDLDSLLFNRTFSRKSKLGAIKLTTAQFYRPSGASTQKKGVLADILLPSLTTHMDLGEADLDYAIEFDRVEPAEFQPLGFVTHQTVAKLIERSQERRKSAKDFEKLEHRIARFLKQKKAKRITLNRAKYEAERKELDAEKAKEKELERNADADDEIKRDFYLDEVFAISADYLSELEKLQLAKRQ